MKKMKLSSKAVISLILSAVLFCMPALGFAMNGNYAVSVHAEDTEPESSSEESVAIVIYFGESIKKVLSVNLLLLFVLSQGAYVGIRCYLKVWLEKRPY